MLLLRLHNFVTAMWMQSMWSFLLNVKKWWMWLFSQRNWIKSLLTCNSSPINRIGKSQQTQIHSRRMGNSHLSDFVKQSWRAWLLTCWIDFFWLSIITYAYMCMQKKSSFYKNTDASKPIEASKNIKTLDWNSHWSYLMHSDSCASVWGWQQHFFVCLYLDKNTISDFLFLHLQYLHLVCKWAHADVTPYKSRLEEYC